MDFGILDVMPQKGFVGIFVVIALVIVVLAAVFLGRNWFSPNSHLTSGKPVQNSPTPQAKPQTKTNSYLGVLCQSNPNPKFTHDFSDFSLIQKVTPPSLIASKFQDRAFLWIDTAKTIKVPIYAPVDADLIRGVYKISQTVETIDYDLHFQVSCEVWFFINHVKDPVNKIKKLFPSTPASSANSAGSTTTSDNITQISPPIHFSAGELIGYTTGTAQAHNFDFAVFDLNHTNSLIGGEGSNDSRFKNFICPFDVLPESLKSEYYKKLDSSLISESNCK